MVQSQGDMWSNQRAPILLMMASSKIWYGSRGFEPMTSMGTNDFMKGANQSGYTMFLNTHVAYICFDVEWHAWYGISPSQWGGLARNQRLKTRGQASRRSCGS
jgi:hypothetical protein